MRRSSGFALFVVLAIAFGAATWALREGSANSLDPPHSLRLRFGPDPATTMTVAWGTEEIGASHVVEYKRLPLGATQTASAFSYDFPDGWCPNPSTCPECDEVPEPQPCIVEGEGRIHVATLTGLSPGSEYEYRVRSGILASPVHRFATAPADSTTTVRFTAFGDSLPDPVVDAGVAADAAASDPVFHLHLGDIAYHTFSAHVGEERWKSFFLFQEPLVAGSAYMTVPGNNDGGDVPGATPFTHISKVLPSWEPSAAPILSFRVGQVGVVGFYHSGEGSPVRYTAAEVDAALAALDDPAIRWRIVTMHSGPYGTGHHDAACAFRSFEGLLASHDVDLVLSSHNHAYERSFPVAAGVPNTSVGPASYPSSAGITYVVQGGASAETYGFRTVDGRPADACNGATRVLDPRGDPVFAPVDYSYRRAEVNSHTRLTATTTGLTVETFALDDSLVDSFTITP